MRIAICNKEHSFVINLRDLINDIYNSIDIITDCFTHGCQLLKSSVINPYDIVFLDFDTPAIDQSLLISKLRSISPGVSVVAVSSRTHSFTQDSTVGCLTKPVRGDEVKSIIDSVAESIHRTKTLHLRNHDGEHYLRISDILFIESSNQNVVTNTLQNSFSVRGNISDYERTLSDEGFFRIHRGYIVALSRIKHILSTNVIMEDNTSLPVSRSRKTQLKNVLFPQQKRDMVRSI